ncbi:hypothetical protein VIGAN_08222400 [Vigna angularis var. angularis]|uniref:Uncharacterized protein n=1 Tax=Vigna angularis var. angularis TaxID=157739 RepID=A0A0S3SRP1_PHAAN|nr:hypothetical protein VIGAN_08222400 [Vigna angularis var. angularis]
MAETQYCIPIIEDDIEINDEFFENFEAPKFVDFTAPDSCRPGDDSHWFCSRVGCDRKHEQELETINKKFIVRERGILKEANLARKFLSPLKETAVKGGGMAMGKHQIVNRVSSVPKSESDTDYYSSCDEKSRPKTQENQSGGIQIDNSRSKVQRKLSATIPYKSCPRTKLQKPNDVNDKFKRKSEMTQRKVLRPLSALARKKGKAVIATKLSVIIEKPPGIVKPKAAKPCSWDRKALTVPIEPKFHRLHVPKDCINRKHT